MKIEDAKVGMKVYLQGCGTVTIKEVAPKFDSREPEPMEYTHPELGCEVTLADGHVLWSPVDWLTPLKEEVKEESDAGMWVPMEDPK